MANSTSAPPGKTSTFATPLDHHVHAPAADWAGQRSLERLGGILVPLAMLFNFMLCFINAQHLLRITNAEIIFVELSIVAVCGAYVYKDISASTYSVLAVLLINCLCLKIFNSESDLLFDFEIITSVVFFTLGMSCSISVGDRLIKILMVSVIAVGLVELFFPDWYQNMMDIWGYYTNKGVITENTANYEDTKFFISGARDGDAGRNFLPMLLGTHRVSSVFLEPVSMGNFPIVCLVWVLGRWDRGLRTAIPLIVGIVVCIVLPDSRFAAGSCLFMVLVRCIPHFRSRYVAVALPILAVVALLAIGSVQWASLHAPRLVDDDLSGRLLFSGELLASWNWSQWFGFSASPVYLLDTGYAYVFNTVGLPMAIVLWFALMSVRAPTREACAMRTMLSAYVATSLCVGESVFSIKTSALLWFLYGLLHNAEGAEDLGEDYAGSERA